MCMYPVSVCSHVHVVWITSAFVSKASLPLYDESFVNTFKHTSLLLLVFLWFFIGTTIYTWIDTQLLCWLCHGK